MLPDKPPEQLCEPEDGSGNLEHYSEGGGDPAVAQAGGGDPNIGTPSGESDLSPHLSVDPAIKSKPLLGGDPEILP